MVRFADRSTELNPDFLSEVVLYALSAADLTMLVALVFVLARNIVKLVVERRRGLPFSRFRAKLVLALLGLTIVPSRARADRRQRADSQQHRAAGSASRSTTCCESATRDRAGLLPRARGARRRPRRAHRAGDAGGRGRGRATSTPCAGRSTPEVDAGTRRAGRGLPRSIDAGARGDVVPLVAVESPALPRGHVARVGRSRCAAARGRRQRRHARRSSRSTAAASWCARGAVVRDPRRAAPSASCSRAITCRASSATPRPADHRGLRELQPAARRCRRPLEGVYLSLFLMMTLMILVSATWTGLYLAKRITRPVQLLAAGAREIGAGHLDHRIEPETRDEFGSLVEAFNTMAGELAASQRKLERLAARSRAQEPAARRAPPLHRDRARADRHRRRLARARRAASRRSTAPRCGCSRSTARSSARAPKTSASARISSRSRRCCSAGPRRRRRRRRRRRSRSSRDGRELHLAAAATPLLRDDGSAGGAVLVFDDVTPLIRTQRVAAWRDVARRLAHEIKNPLTPIQLCAERMRRQFSSAPAAGARAGRGVHVDDRRRSRVAQGAGRRVRAVRAHAGAARGAGRPERACSTRHAGALQRPLPRDSHRAALLAERCRRCASTSSRCGASSSTSSTTPSRRSAAAPRAPGRTAKRRRSSSRRGTTRATASRGSSSSDNGPGISAGRSRQAVHAVLLDQAARQRPRPRDRPPHHRRARRQHRSRRQCTERDRVHDRAADMSLRLITHGGASCPGQSVFELRVGLRDTPRGSRGRRLCSRRAPDRLLSDLLQLRR